MSKFTDKLARLHASRVRALEADDGEQQRVFVAEPVTTAPPPPPAAPEPPIDTAARRAVRDQLVRGAALGRKSSKPRVRMQQATQEPEVRREPAPPPASRPSDNAVGERLTDLRIRAEALIEVGGLESALPLLHEMAALSPTHPFPLAQLASYWHSVGNGRLAALYAERLAAIAPY